MTLGRPEIQSGTLGKAPVCFYGRLTIKRNAKMWHIYLPPSTGNTAQCVCVCVLKYDGNSEMHEEACPDRKRTTQRGGCVITHTHTEFEMLYLNPLLQIHSNKQDSDINRGCNILYVYILWCLWIKKTQPASQTVNLIQLWSWNLAVSHNSEVC